MGKIAPSERLREELQRFLRDMGEVEEGASALSELVRRAATLIVQEGLEAEQRDFIGRERYERGPGRGYRSGYVRGRLETAEGRLEVERPQVRGAEETYRSGLYDFLRGHSDVLERLATEMYARGLSTRDIEAAFTDGDGVCLLSRSAVSEVTETLWQEYEAFQARDLSEVSVLYLFLDGLYEPCDGTGCGGRRCSVRGGSRWRGRRCCCRWRWGIGELRGVAGVSEGSRDPRAEVAADDHDRWGAGFDPGGGGRKPEVKAHLVAIRDAPTPEAGRAAVKEFLARFGRELPSACTCLSEDPEALLAHLRFPWRHRKFVRTTNLIERSFELSEAGACDLDPGGDPLATHRDHRPRVRVAESPLSPARPDPGEGPGGCSVTRNREELRPGDLLQNLQDLTSAEDPAPNTDHRTPG